MSSPEVVHTFLVDELGVPASTRNDEDLLASELLDSQGMMELVAFLEERFAIQVEDADLVPENFKSVDAMTALVAGKGG